MSRTIGAIVYTSEDLIVQADIAMYDAKDAGKNRSRVYNRDEQSRERLMAREDWMMRLRQAVGEELFVLYAQPIIPICSNGVPRFELLLRLPDGHGDLIPRDITEHLHQLLRQHRTGRPGPLDTVLPALIRQI